jgi:hypothetical protein
MNKNLFYKILTIGLILISGVNSFGQIAVNGPKEMNPFKNCFTTKLEDSDYQKLKNSTIYFVCPNIFLEERDSIQNILNDAWDYNEIVVIFRDELQDYINKKNSAFFSFGFRFENTIVKELYYQLTIGKAVFARITIDYECRYDSILKKTVKYGAFNNDYIHSLETEGATAIYNELYSEVDVNNFKPSIMANYLKQIESYLRKKELLPCGKIINNRDELPQLVNETLYIAETKVTNFKCERANKFDNNKLMAYYPFPYKLMSYNQLNQKILDGDNFYYAICVPIDKTYEYLSIYKSKTGECIFNDLVVGNYWKPNNFKDIAKEISR